MRRFEMVEGKASKFWEVEVQDNLVVVHFGRIGTKGQSRTKKHISNLSATYHADERIKEKLAEGYLEIK